MKKIIYTLLLFIIIFAAANTLKFEDCFSQSGWLSQPLPVSGQVQDLKFFDANTGLVAMYQSNVMLRTTNGGYNWYTLLNNQVAWEFNIIDSITVYAVGSGPTIDGFLLRSYNRGATWDSVPVANSWTVNGISFVNRDTGWVGGSSGGLPYLWRTTNAGLNWTVQSDNTGFGKVFFLKTKVNGEYVGWSMNYTEMWKTTNSGNNWTQIQPNFGMSQMYFINKDTGYVSAASKFKRTINGGLNWTEYQMPTNNYVFFNSISSFKIINNDSIFGDNGYRIFPNNTQRGIIWVSTNGGINWGFQQPDTNMNNGQYHGIDFINKDTGWSSTGYLGIRTNDGGGPIIISGINTFITERPSSYILEQNYPNPFNPSTRINFSIPSPSFVTLTVYDITGKEILKIYNNEFFTAGNYFAAIDLGKMNLSSGLYFYRMTAAGRDSGIDFSLTKKMLYIK